MSVDRDSRRSNSNGLALVCLIFGILACMSSFILIGGLIGLVGLIFGAVHLFQRRRANVMAWTGVGFSVMGIFLSGMFCVFYIRAITNAFEAVVAEIKSHEAAQVHDEIPLKGQAAPELVLTTIDGKTISLSELKGKRVILDFWATWCGPCRAEIPHFVKLREEVPEADLVIIGISDEEVAEIKDFAEEHKVNYLMVSASDLPAPFSEIESIPTTYFIDRQGIIQEVLVGYHDFDSLKLHATSADYQPPAKDPAEAAIQVDITPEVDITPAPPVDAAPSDPVR